jgi:cytochrome c-type biogenesis protein CcmH
MLLWLIILALTGAASAYLAWPLLRPRPSTVAVESGAGIREVYKDQLTEIEADLARGLIGVEEAAAARLELARRLLAQADDPAPTPVSASAPSPQLLAGIAAAVPILALVLYAALGAPSQPGRPTEAAKVLDMRTPKPSGPDIDELVAKVEARLRSNPEDGRGWDVIAPVYLKSRRYDEAEAAFARAIEMLGETSKRLLGLAESAVRKKDGQISDEARAVFEKVVKAEPSNLEARFWLALAHEQRGSFKQAADDYRALLSAAPPDAPWRATVMERLAAVAGAAPSTSDTAIAPKGPTASEVAAAGDMTPEARQQMIGGMVAGLHARLKVNGRDAGGWQRLLRAYGVMGDLPKAKEALAEARRALAEDKVGLGAVDEVAREMGLGS